MKINKTELSEDEKIFRANCRPCHVLPDREDLSSNEWTRILEDHEDRINLSADDRSAVMRYLSETE
jgi:nitrate/TMAO reductase-like tetraheme cytochrome c subunit